MSEDTQHVADIIRDGRYFEEARSWYAALYIGPISERSFFLVIAALAGMVGLFGVAAVMALLPITDRPGLIVRSERPDETIPNLTRVKPTGRPVEPAMEQVLAKTYVWMREQYDVSHYTSSFAFVVSHSDAATATAYAQANDSRNPQSPAAILGYNGQKLVKVRGVKIGKPEGNEKLRRATIDFDVDYLNIQNPPATTRWTASMEYYYTPTVVTFMKGKTGRLDEVKVDDPQFQVVSYAVTQGS